MKKIRIIITLAFVLSIFTFATAQNTISEIVNDTTLNYYQKVKKIHENGNAIMNNASEKELKQYYRWNWFWSSRTDNKGSMKLAHKSMKKFLKEPALDPVSINSVYATWQCEGPYNYYSGVPSNGNIGRVKSLWADPDNADIILLGSNSNGLWKTTNGGSNWTRLNPGIPGGVTDIAVHPTKDWEIFITTGVAKNGIDTRTYATGIWRTTNAGATWHSRNGNLNMQAMYIRKIKICPANTNVMFALATDAVYKSTDKGLNWSLNLSAKAGQVFYDIVFDPQSSSSYLYVSGNNCFYYTTTLGGYWVDWSDTVGSGSDIHGVFQ